MNKMYMIRAGRGNYLFDQFEEKNIVAIGWNDLGDLSLIEDKQHLKEMLSRNHGYKEQATHTNAGQISRFHKEMKIGDYVVTYSSRERSYLIGTIESDYKYDDAFEFNNIRNVKWLGRVSRDILSASTKNSLGSILTIFEIKDQAKKELLDKLYQKDSTNVTDDSGLEDDRLENIKENIEDNAREFIKDKIIKLSWEEMQDLVAALLRALGYKTKISPKGPDRGKDIIASPDGLGLEDPCIYVEVKHRPNQRMEAPDIRNFIGGMRSYRKGIYVSTGGFTKEAMYEVERANVALSTIDLDELVDFIISNYDNFDSEGRALVPLRKIYWPA